MQKNLYSLILTDEVVARVDALAQENNTNRSNMINQILADYVSYTTPEKKINYIFDYINSLFNTSAFDKLRETNERMLSLKTSLDYKYRPTVRYSVELYRDGNETIGELKVLFRTQSYELIYKLKQFFELLIEIEKKYLSQPTEYSFDETKFVRTFVIPNGKMYSNEEIARGISDYIKNFDAILKNFLLDRYTDVSQAESAYKIYLTKSILI